MSIVNKSHVMIESIVTIRLLDLTIRVIFEALLFIINISKVITLNALLCWINALYSAITTFILITLVSSFKLTALILIAQITLILYSVFCIAFTLLLLLNRIITTSYTS